LRTLSEIRKEKYLVIGSNCFTGSHIVSRLLSVPGAHVVGLSRSPEKKDLYLPYRQKPLPGSFRFEQVDIVRQPKRLMTILERFRPSYVINVAALSEVFQSHLTPTEYFQVNTTAVVRLADYLRKQTWLKRLVHISSAEIYGGCSEPVIEDRLPNPSTPYAASKAAADFYLLSAQAKYRLPVTLIRSTNVYGPHQQLYKIVPRSLIHLRQGKKIELHGGGKAVRPFIHIRDVVEGIWRVMGHPDPKPIYHFSSNQTWSIARIVKFLCEKRGEEFSQVTQYANDRATQDQRYLLDYSLAQQDLAWQPEIDFATGVEETMQWIDSNWDAVVREPLQYIHPQETIARRAKSGPKLPRANVPLPC